MILQVIEKLGLKKDSVVFCSSNSTTKLNEAGIKAVENWDIKEQKPFMFFTSRFYAALDIELKVQPDIMFVTEPYLYEYTIIDPCTDAVQAIGRSVMEFHLQLISSAPTRIFLSETKKA